MIPDDVIDRLQWSSLIEFCLTLGAIVFAAGAVWAVMKRVWPGLRKLVSFVEALGRLPTFMVDADENFATIKQSLAEVRHEVLPNNGGSLRDDFDLIGLRVEKIDARQTNDFQRINHLEDTITRRVIAREMSRDAQTGDVPTFPSQNTED